MTLSHHTLGLPVATDWSRHDPDFERLVEICSIHGNSEAFGAPMSVRGAKAGHGARDALARGYRLGFVGSGDTHNGHPGLGDPFAPLGGVVGIWAEELTRESVWKALMDRRVFATSGPRILLEFEVDGHPMGSTFTAEDPGAPRILRVEAHAPFRIERVEIFKNAVAVIDAPVDDLRVAFSIEDLEEANDVDVYYARVRLQHDQLAWSSPVWVERSEASAEARTSPR